MPPSHLELFMAVVRCSQCQLPITEQEAQTGSCPVCGAAVAAPVAAKNPAAPASMPRPAPDRATYLLFAGLAALLLLMSFLLIVFMPGKSPKSPEKKEIETAFAPLPEAKPTPPPIPTADEPRPEPVKIEPKKDEPKKPETNKEEPKKEQPKKEQPKKEIAKEPQKEPAPKVERKAIPAPVAKARLAVLPFFADDAFKIDGDLAEWRARQPLPLSAFELGSAPKKTIVDPRIQDAFAGYCSKGLLIAVDVVDTSGDLENTGKPERGLWPFWFNDCLEVYIDTLNKRAPQRGEDNAHQFFAFPFGTPGDEGIAGYESRIFGNGRESVVPIVSTGANAMLRAGQKKRTGWTLEMLIPRASLRDFDLKPGMTIGFELQLDTGTNTFYFWANERAGRISVYPRLWGEAFLAGADGLVETLDAAKKPQAKFRPGETLHLRLTDQDVSVDGTRKASITLRATSGDSKVIALDESMPGVFTGSLPMRTREMPQPKDALVVMDGDTIEIDYLDAIRSDGARNVLVQQRVKIKE